MKQSIYKSLFFIALLFGALTSCYNPLSEDVSISSVRRGREFTVVPSMIPMVDALATKSQYTGNDDQVYDWNLFIFEGTSDAAVLCGKYYNSGSSSDMSISFTVKLDAEYTYFAIANVGKQIDNLAGYTTLGALRSARIAISGPRQGLPAATSFTHKFTRSDYEAAQAAHTYLTFPGSINKLTRLVGRYDIVVQKDDLQIWDLDITSLKLYGAGSVTPWVTGSYTTQDVELNDADNGGATNQDLYKLNRGEKVSFYPVENMISTPSALSGNTDMWAKVPGNVGNAHPSYIEMTGTATVNDGSGLSKPVTYRFYLGTDNVKNFEVERNVTHTLTFVPNDETITNGHNGNWKITPGSFTDTRSLMFASNSTTPTSSTNPIRVRAGESLDEAIIRTVGGSPSNFKYNVSFSGQLASDGNMLVRNETSGDVAHLNGTTLSSLHLTAKANIDAEGFVKINTIDQPNESPKQDKLYIQIYNAWLEITNDPLVLTYEWNAKQSGSGQNAGFRSSVNWTANPSSGWSVSPASGSASLTGTSVSIYPDDVNSSTTANKTGQVTLTPDGGVAKTVTVIQKFKPVVTTQPAGLTWTASEGSSDYRELVITSNETWTLTVSPGWTVKDTNGNPVTGGGTSNNGASTSVTVRVYPDGPNVSIPPTDKTGSVVIAPSRGTDDEKATVTLTHQKAAVSLALTENGHDWTWKQKDVDTDNFTFHVTGNLNWSASVSDPDNWRIVSGASGSGSGNVVVRPKAVNSSTSDIKGATLTIQCTDSGVTVDSPTATLRQLVHPNIGLASSGNLQWGWDNTTAQTITLTLSPAGYGWQAALVNGDASHWVMTEDHTDNTISIRPATVNDDVNNAPSIQVRITATDPDDTQSSAVVTCTHNARAAYFDFVDPSQQNLSWRWYEGASNTVVVNFSTSETWSHTVSSGSSYFSATKNGNSLTIAPVGANTGGVRNGAISIEVDGHPELNKTITLAQEARPTVSVAPTGYDWAWTATSADAQSFTVTCTPGYTWSASKTDANNKFSLSGTTGFSDAAFVAGPVGTNEDTEHPYSATIIVTLVNSDDPHAGDITVNVPLSQARKVQFYITPISYDWGWQGGSFNFTVVDNQGLSWTPEVVGTDASSFVATKSGNTVSVNVGSNSSYSSKSATLRIKVGSEVKAEATLSQEAHPSLLISALDGTSWAYNETGGKRYSVSTSGISSWSASIDNTSDFTVSTSGNIVTVTPKNQNTGTTVRNVRLTVTSNNYSVDGEYDYDDLTQGVNGGMVTGATLQVYNGSSWVTNATFTVGAQQSYRVKVDYLSGSSDYVTSGFELTSGNAGVVSVNGDKISTSAVGAGTATVSTTYEGYPTSVSITVNDQIEYRNLSISLNPDVIDDVNNLSSTATAVADRYVNNVLDQAGVDVTSSTSFQVLEDNPPVTQSGNVFTWNNSDGDDTDITIRGTFSGMTADATLTVKKEYEPQPRYFIEVTGFKIYDSSENEASDVTVNYGGSESYSVKAVVDVFYGTARWSATYEGTEEVNVSASDVSWNWTGDSEYANGRTVSNTNQTGTDKQVVFSSATASRSFFVSCHSASEYVIKNHTLSSSAFTVTLPSEDVPTYEYQVVISPTSATIAHNGSQQFTAKYQRKASNSSSWEDVMTTQSEFTWTSSNEDAATASVGVATGCNTREGDSYKTTTITAEYNGYSAEATLRVNDKPVTYAYRVVISPTSATIAHNGSQQFTAKYQRKASNSSSWEDVMTTQSEFTWTSSNEDAATVSVGVATGCNTREGDSYKTTTITAEYNGYSAEATLRVNDTPAPAEVLTSLDFYIGGSKTGAVLDAENGYSLSYSLVANYSTGRSEVVAPSSYLVSYNTGARGLLLSQGTASLNGQAYYGLNEGSYSNIDEDCYVYYGGVTSNTVRLTSDITWEYIDLGFDATEGTTGGSIHIYTFYRSTLSPLTLRSVAASNMQIQKMITNNSIPVSDIILSVTASGNTITVSHSAQYSDYSFDVIISVTTPLGTYDFTVECTNVNANHYTNFVGDSYTPNAH